MFSNESDITVRIKGDADSLARELNRTKKELSSFQRGIGTIAKASAALFAVDAVVGFGKAVFNTTAEFQKFEAVLSNSLGSSVAAKRELSQIQEIAKTMPFSVAELSGAFIKLNNQGLKPSGEELKNLADVAAFTGKGIDQLAEAVLDAGTGEFERLKEFGIKAKSVGDKVVFTFRGQATEIDKTSKAINEYIIGLGDLKGVQGATEAISRTLGGQVNNLGDAFDQLAVALGNLLNGPAAGAVGFLSNLLTETTGVVKNIQAVLGTVDFSVVDTGSVEDARYNLERLTGVLAELQKGDNELLPGVDEKITTINKAIQDQIIAINQLGKAELGRARFEELGNEARKTKEALESNLPTFKKLKDELAELKDAQEIANLSDAVKIQAKIEGVEKEIKNFEAALNRTKPILEAGVKIDKSAFTLDDLKIEFQATPKRDGAALQDFATETIGDLNRFFGDQQGLRFDLFGGATFDTANAQIELLKTNMQALVDVGKGTSEQFQALNDQLSSLTFIQDLSQAANVFGDAFSQAMDQGATAAEGFAQAAGQAARFVIQTLIAEGVAGIMRGVLTSPAFAALGPAAIPIAAATGTAAAAIFSSLVPKFASGAVLTGPTLNIAGEAGKEYVMPLPNMKKLADELTDGRGRGGRVEVQGVIKGRDILISSQRSAAREALLA